MKLEFSVTQKLLLASKLNGVGRKTLLELAEDQLFLRLPPEDWSDYSSIFKTFTPNSPTYIQAVNKAKLDIDAAEKFGHKIISVCDPEYPKLLINNRDQPPLLFIKGNIENITNKYLAIIGTRDPSTHGKIICERITKYFASNGWSIVSGLALGIDTIAHQATLDANGKTIAVLAHGLEKVSPKSNTNLAERIVDQGGALITEYPYNTSTFPSNFVERDKIQAALSQGVIMIQSDLQGGSLHASRATLAHGRKLVVPYPTNQDINSKYSKIKANLLIADQNDTIKTDFLKCHFNDLKNIKIIRSKEDYSTIEKILLSEN